MFAKVNPGDAQLLETQFPCPSFQQGSDLLGSQAGFMRAGGGHAVILTDRRFHVPRALG